MIIQFPLAGFSISTRQRSMIIFSMVWGCDACVAPHPQKQRRQVADQSALVVGLTGSEQSFEGVGAR
ncbi:MAG: hypothetical protein WAK85_14955, partial [Xanthobacteraceae bacterium]